MSSHVRSISRSNPSVVRDASVVDEHAEFLARAHVGDRRHTVIGAEISDQGAHLDVGECADERFEPLAATAHDYQVVPSVPSRRAKA